MKNIEELGNLINKYSFLFQIDTFEKPDTFLVDLASHLKKLGFEYDIFFEYLRVNQIKSRNIKGVLILNQRIVTESMKMDIKIYSNKSENFYLDIANLLFLELKELIEYWTITEEMKNLNFKDNDSKLIREEIFKLEIQKEIIRAYRYNKIFSFIIIETAPEKILKISRVLKDNIKRHDLIGKFLKDKIGLIIFDLEKSEEEYFFETLINKLSIEDIKKDIRIYASYFPYDGISFEHLLKAALKNQIKIK